LIHSFSIIAVSVSEFLHPIGQKICYSNGVGIQVIRKKVEDNFTTLVHWGPNKSMNGLSGNFYAFKGKLDDFETVANADEYLWTKIGHTIQNGERIATYFATPDLKKGCDLQQISFRKKVVFVENRSLYMVHYFGNAMQCRWTKKSEEYQRTPASQNHQRHSEGGGVFKLKPFRENQCKNIGGSDSKLVIKKDDITHYWNEKTYLEPKSGNVYVFGGRSDQFDLIVTSDNYEWEGPAKDNSTRRRAMNYFAKPDRSKILPPMSDSAKLTVSFRKVVMFYPENNMYIVYYFGDDAQYPWTLKGSSHQNSSKSLIEQTNYHDELLGRSRPKTQQKSKLLQMTNGHQFRSRTSFYQSQSLVNPSSPEASDILEETSPQIGAFNYFSQVNRPLGGQKQIDVLDSPSSGQLKKNSNSVEILELDSDGELVSDSPTPCLSPQDELCDEFENLEGPCETGDFYPEDPNLSHEEDDEDIKVITTSNPQVNETKVRPTLKYYRQNQTKLYRSLINKLENLDAESKSQLETWNPEVQLEAKLGLLYVFCGEYHAFNAVASSDPIVWTVSSLIETPKKKAGYYAEAEFSAGTSMRKRIIFLKENSLFVVFYHSCPEMTYWSEPVKNGLSEANLLQPVATNQDHVYISNQSEMIKDASKDNSLQTWTPDMRMAGNSGDLYVFKGTEDNFEGVSFADNFHWRLFSMTETDEQKKGYFMETSESDDEKAFRRHKNIGQRKRITFFKENSVYVVFYNLTTAASRDLSLEDVDGSQNSCNSRSKSHSMKRRSSQDSKSVSNTKKEKLE